MVVKKRRENAGGGNAFQKSCGKTDEKGWLKGKGTGKLKRRERVRETGVGKGRNVAHKNVRRVTCQGPLCKQQNWVVRVSDLGRVHTERLCQAISQIFI